MVKTIAKEIDVRVNVLNSILHTPHKEIDPLIPIHIAAEDGDPLFYVKLGIWYDRNGTIRDHKKLFAAKIIASQYPEFRKVGEKLLTQMGARDANTSMGITEKFFKGKSGGIRRRVRRTVAAIVEAIEDNSQKDNGIQLLRNAGVIRDLIVKYRLPVKYEQTSASLHFRTKGVDVTPYKAFEAIRMIKNGGLTEEATCTLIDTYRLPPLQVMGSLSNLTPAIAASMLKGMSSAEAVNFMKMFERKGLTNIQQFTKAVEKKVTEGKKSESASMRSMKAAKSLSDGKGAEALAKITDDFVSRLPRIKKSVVLAIDKSHSMQKAIAIGKELATILAAVVDSPMDNLKVCVYNNVTSEIPVSEKNDYTDFEARFRYIKANGTTSLGSVIEYIDAKEIKPDVIIFIGDANENDLPLLDRSLAKSDNVVGAKIINLKVGDPVFDLNVTKEVASSKSLEIENMRYDGDYYSLPNIVKIITSGGIKDTIAEIDAIDINKFINQAAK
jgi:hypothetical protein